MPPHSKTIPVPAVVDSIATIHSTKHTRQKEVLPMPVLSFLLHHPILFLKDPTPGPHSLWPFKFPYGWCQKTEEIKENRRSWEMNTVAAYKPECYMLIGTHPFNQKWLHALWRYKKFPLISWCLLHRQTCKNHRDCTPGTVKNARTAWLWIMALWLTSPVTLGKLLTISILRFSHYKMEIIV